MTPAHVAAARNTSAVTGNNFESPFRAATVSERCVLMFHRVSRGVPAELLAYRRGVEGCGSLDSRYTAS